MNLATPTPAASRQKRATHRFWSAPVARAYGLWLTVALLLASGSVVVYLFALKTQPFPGPFSDPLRGLGVVTFVLVLGTAAYGLRRRFARNLPGKVQSWLWMHVWIGGVALLVAILHENFTHILNNYCQNAGCLTNAYGGTSALLALLLLVLTGLFGRALDRWQAGVIAREASTNGAGIIQASEERLFTLETVLERLCAGKSEAFKEYCLLALSSLQMSGERPELRPGEQHDFQRARDTLQTYSQLANSIRRQKRARQIMRIWRTIHLTLAAFALIIIVFHASMELLVNVLHIVQPG